jgi:SAM-dependent methyltransferase
MSGKRSFAFDARYYQRYYRDARTRVTESTDSTQLVDFIAGYLGYLGQPVRNILDLGCGLGVLQKPLLRRFKGARYVGVEQSQYACERYGFTQGSVTDFRSRGRFDLVICKGVLQYLDARDAARALANLAELCRGCLYLEALTREDWQDAADRKRTDGDVYLRPASFYRRRLRGPFQPAGGGIFVSERSPAVLYALETL